MKRSPSHVRSAMTTEAWVHPAEIEGVELVRLPVFSDERGQVLRMLRATDPYFRGFGEVYFSSVYRGMVKAWKRHHRLTASYACVHGLVRMVLYDARSDPRSAGRIAEVLLGPDEHRLLVVPPGVWNGFVGLADPTSVLVNLATEPYDPAEFDRLEPSSSVIPYRWESSLAEPVSDGSNE